MKTTTPWIIVPKQDSLVFSKEVIALIEKEYDVTYVRDSSLEYGGEYLGRYAIFYKYKPAAGHSNYLAVTPMSNHIALANGISGIAPQTGFYYKNKFYYSPLNHELVYSSDEKRGIDGGRSYTRLLGDFRAFDLHTMHTCGTILYINNPL
jgi:hypothetical protein